MRHRNVPAATLVVAMAALVSACAPASAPAAVADARATTSAQATTATSALPQVEVFKSPSCGCCSGWVDHLRQAGFPVRVHETDALEPLRKQLGIPYGKGSCHTAMVDGYVIEGHVPAADIQRLLAEHPNVRGLALPGMPAGSPGMEVPDGHVQAYTVERIEHDGSTRTWAVHGR
ncbi:MAG: DUF411 domain-containing protein [Pseudoxanthomonas sp.]|nr:DUF411 domain-containing protein [Pseudoxanthomonas sp.]